MRTSGRSTLPTCLRHDAGDQLLHALAVTRRTGNRPALVILQTQGEHHFFPTVQTYIFVRRHERDLPFVGCANSPPASTTVTRDAAADLVIAPESSGMGGSGRWYLEKSPHSSISCSPVVSWQVPLRDLPPLGPGGATH